MYTIVMLALLGVAEAETPKKKSSDKKEESSTSNSKSTSKKKTTKSSSTKGTSKSSTVKKSTIKSTQTKKPSSTQKVDHNPAQKQVGQERNTQPSAHQPIGSGTQSNTPGRTRAPNTVERPQVGHETPNAPEAHSPIGNQNEPQGPGRTRAPNNVERPQVGYENSNTPEAHSPIGGGHNRNPGRTRAPENVDRPEVGRETPNTPEAHSPIGGPERRPERTRPSRDSESSTPNTPSGTRTVPSNRAPEKSSPSIERGERKSPSNNKQTPEFQREYSECESDCGHVATNPPKVQNGTSSNRSPSSTTTKRRQPGVGASSTFGNGSQGVFGLSTLSYASDYVDGGAYEDGGIGFSFGYRPVPQFEIEAAYGRYTDSLLEGSRERLNRPFQLTGQLHPFPNALLSPFLVGGYAWNDIVLNDTYLVDGDESVAVQESVLEGLVLGAGMTLNVHQNVALELDGRLFQYNNIEYWQPAGDTATLVSMGVVLSF